MSFTIFLYSLIGLLTGILIPLAWLRVTGLTTLSKTKLDNINLELNELKTYLAVSKSSLEAKINEEKNILEKLEHKSFELNLVNAEMEGIKSTREQYALQILELKKQVESLTKEGYGLRNSFQTLQITYERTKEHMRSEEEKYQTQKQEVEKIGEKFEVNFRNLANSILEERSQKFDEHQKTSLKHILEPLQKEIEIFKKDFTEKFNKESNELVSLGAYIKSMNDMSNKLTEQTENLTSALKGQSKQQGNWGEAILESILEYAGLQKGVHYFVQESHLMEDGNRIQPDVRVRYPDNRHIIIDSKVSLIHYERYHNADLSSEKDKHLENLINSFKSHINDLSGKNYQDVQPGTLDFVMMFVPVEGAFITAMQSDRELWQYAYKKRILLISPTNLIAAMKLVQDFWQKDQNHKNSEEIAAKAAGLYEKLVGFMETFDKIGESLQKAEYSFSKAKKILSTGKGNLISKAEQMKRLNNMKTSKSLPGNLASNALFEDGLEDIGENLE